MNRDDQEKLIDYWTETAAHDFETMKSLYQGSRYDAALFFGHIVLEKMLKALVVKNTGDHAPYTHNLVQLAEIGNAPLSDQDMSFLREANTFNIEARYPEAKLRFYKLCTQEYTQPRIELVDKLYSILCHEIKQSK